MQQDKKKEQVAQAALDYIKGHDVVGVGSGSTVACFIRALAGLSNPPAVVAASQESEALLRDLGINVLDLNETGNLSVFVDGADEATHHRTLIKGGGGAMTREKIVAAASRQFVCIIDDTKLVDVLGHRCPVPVEVIMSARSYVARQLVALGGVPAWRTGFLTDNGHPIIDVGGLPLVDPAEMERMLNQIAGVVSNGLFVNRPADVLLIAGDHDVRVLS